LRTHSPFGGGSVAYLFIEPADGSHPPLLVTGPDAPERVQRVGKQVAEFLGVPLQLHFLRNP
jgi:hypothetical protein